MMNCGCRLLVRAFRQAGGTGYEILDGMSGFGTTSQMFDALHIGAPKKVNWPGRSLRCLPSAPLGFIWRFQPDALSARGDNRLPTKNRLNADHKKPKPRH